MPPQSPTFSSSLHCCPSSSETAKRVGAVHFASAKRHSSRGWKRFFPADALRFPPGLPGGPALLSNGHLTVRIHLEIEYRDDHAKVVDAFGNIIPDHRDNKLPPVIDEKSSAKREREEESDPEEFLGDIKYTDLVLECGEKKYHCHKYMLAKKSDVFEAMFSHSFSESKDNKVSICDIEPVAIREMLRYIYVGRASHLWSYAKEIFAAADKYQIKELKDECERHLGSSMQIGTVCGVLCFASQYGAESLKNQAIEYIVQNAEAVTGTKGWEELLSAPGLVTEVVRQMAFKSPAGKPSTYCPLNLSKGGGVSGNSPL